MSTTIDKHSQIFNINEKNTHIVMFSFLSRADTAPLEERSRGQGHVLDQNGNVVPDPAAAQVSLALEHDLNLNFEHWGGVLAQGTRTSFHSPRWGERRNDIE